MSGTVTPQRFHEIDWRIVRDDASTHFRTGSFAAGVALVNAIAGWPTPRAMTPTSIFGRTA